MTVLAYILVCLTGPEQRLGHGFFVNPAAPNHSSKTEGDGIEHLVPLAIRCRTEFGDRTVERCCRVSSAAQAAIRSRYVCNTGCGPLAIEFPIWADDIC